MLPNRKSVGRVDGPILETAGLCWVGDEGLSAIHGLIGPNAAGCPGVKYGACGRLLEGFNLSIQSGCPCQPALGAKTLQSVISIYDGGVAALGYKYWLAWLERVIGLGDELGPCRMDLINEPLFVRGDVWLV